MQVEESDRRWREAIAGGGERLQVSGGERSPGVIESRIARIARRQIRRIAPNREALYKNPNREARCNSKNTSVKVGTLDPWSFVAL